ncbi:hypothetical protein [Wolbachia endosymbiont (group E) of Neria commutata]|uniref:hypothetical protein n=1 Tax=Wolbachia endosymbiont (group E) of Neria commutata TaxID=3066149 RepID=UPI003132F3F4
MLKEPERIAKEHQFNLLKYENKQPDDILEKQENMLDRKKLQQELDLNCYRTVESRYKNTCKSCNREWILKACVKNNFYDEIGWIPVSSTCMTEKR